MIFQVSVADSSSLIDSPMASRLGPNRGVLHSEEQGRLEKFRPYSLPTDPWLAWVGEQLRRRIVEPASRARVERGKRANTQARRASEEVLPSTPSLARRACW